ncbi:MAG: OmpA family protein [Gemmatimonadota bacterium]|jgi:peptidoglycan-associated lipoprotein
MPNSLRRSLALMIAPVLVVACRPQRPPEPEPQPTPVAAADTAAERARREAADRAAREAAAAKARADSVAIANAAAGALAGAAARTMTPASAGDTEIRALLTAPVFFDYDAAEIRDDARAVLEAKLSVLAANPAVRLRITGHTDDRGAEEYNLALGQRRAAALQRWLVQRGVAADRFVIVSYGEEGATCTAADETCWVKNRRAEFEITSAPASLVAPK